MGSGARWMMRKEVLLDVLYQYLLLFPPQTYNNINAPPFHRVKSVEDEEKRWSENSRLKYGSTANFKVDYNNVSWLAVNFQSPFALQRDLLVLSILCDL